MKLLNDQLLIKLTKDNKYTTDSGLVLDGYDKKKPDEGIVIAAGPGPLNPKTGTRYRMELKPGHTVLFDKFNGAQHTIDGELHIILREYAVVGYYHE